MRLEQALCVPPLVELLAGAVEHLLVRESTRRTGGAAG